LHWVLDVDFGEAPIVALNLLKQVVNHD